MDCFFIALKCRVCDFFRTFRFSRFLHVSFFKSSTFRFAGSMFHRMPTAEIFPGVLDIMQKIQSSGLTIGVVTGSGQRPLIKRLLSDFQGFLTEDHIVSAYDVQRGKPNPDPYLMGLRKTGNYEPWQGIVVENAPLGVRAGSAANIFTVGINSGPLPDSALSDNGANVVLQRMTELCDLWGEILAARN